MNYREYLTAMLSRFNVTPDDVSVILINQDINGDDDVVAETAKKAMFTEFRNFLPLANLSEGGMSVSWNIEALKIWYSSLAKELNEDDLLNPLNNDVEDASYFW